MLQGNLNPLQCKLLKIEVFILITVNKTTFYLKKTEQTETEVCESRIMNETV